MKIAVVGSGISGLSAAWFLKDEHEVTVFEKEKNLGGHTNTVKINYNNNELNVDTGFIVFNYKTYFHLQKFFEALNVEVAKSKMSFSVSGKNIEYSSDKFFPRLKDIFNFKHFRLLFEILKFNRIAKKKLISKTETLEDFLNRFSFSKYFVENYIYPMVSAIWSCNQNNAKSYPALSFVEFFKNHGLLQVTRHPQWYYVKNGSYEYVKKIKDCKEIEFKNHEVTKCVPHKDGVKIFYNNKEKTFDKVIIATHADEAFEITKEPVLKGFDYSTNEAFLHKDDSFMPKNKKVWASWNFISGSKKSLSLTYYMNNLQEIPKNLPTFVTLNPDSKIKKNDIFYKTTYTHPIFNFKALEIQKNISAIQGINNIYYVGSYLGYGFHEDGIRSSYEVCKTLLSKMPW